MIIIGIKTWNVHVHSTATMLLLYNLHIFNKILERRRSRRNQLTHTTLVDQRRKMASHLPTYGNHFISICGLFKDANRSLDYTVSNDRMINELERKWQNS
jgi:hypothetical protein